MTRRIRREAAQAAIAVGTRVLTIDGLPGRVLFAAASYAPGVTEYEVILDHGLGQGTYTASQLRPIPADLRAGSPAIPPGLLPAGVTAAFETEAGEVHLASDDYPEMGAVLHDRPDPGRLVSVIGTLRTTAAATYGRPEDPRDEDYNGGEQDTGTYWAEPGQQDWIHQHIGPQEEAPPPVFDSPVMARLAEIEEAARYTGGAYRGAAYRLGTTINGTQIDDHGDAPEHGTVPRSAGPDRYDARSTEGDGDPRWSDAPPEDKLRNNGATVGMYPEGMSGGDGPGLPIGAVTAHQHGIQGTTDLEHHLISEHGVSTPELSDLRLSAWRTYPEELERAHARVSGGRPLLGWDGETVLGHGRLMTAREMQGHLGHEHGLWMGSGHTPHEMQHQHEWQHQDSEFVPGEHHGRAIADGLSETDAPDEHGTDDDTAATYHAHEGPLDPVFGSRTASRHVPWTGNERYQLHSYPVPSGSWGDFVNREHFTNHSPAEEEEPGAVEEMRAEAVHRTGAVPGEEDWQSHLMGQHGWSEENVRRAEEHGQDFGHMHGELHRMNMAGHDHPEPRQRAADSFGARFQHDHVWGRPGMGGAESPNPEVAVRNSVPNDWGAQRWNMPLHTLSSVHEAAQTPDEEAWRWHMMDKHGWTPMHFEGLERRGDRIDDIHAGLHDAGLGKHQHTRPVPEAYRLMKTDQALTGMFGPNAKDLPGHLMPSGWPLARPEHGGSAGDAPVHGLTWSVPFPETEHPMDMREHDPGGWKRTMSAIDPPHPHDDDVNSLDAGPSEGDELMTEKHDDNLESPLPPAAWPMAGTGITEGGPALTQGRHDGDRGHGKFPPPPPPPAPAGAGDEDLAPGEEPDEPGEDGKGGSNKITLEVKAHLGAFEAAIADPRFRFEFTAAWRDVVSKARRIRKEGRVRITHASAGVVIGAVSGDHDVYETGIQRPPHRPQTIQHWACGCPWASFHQDKSLGTRYAGRPCSHVMALQFEAQARTMFGRELEADGGVPNQELVVKSLPPWTPSGWSQHWLAPSASLHAEHDDEDGCLYVHEGPCPQTGLDRTAESLKHQRPPEFYSEIMPNPDRNMREDDPDYDSSTHVLNGYLGPKLAGRLHFTQSDDGVAHHVDMLHTTRDGRGGGIASAMMDDLYSHVKAKNGWLDHGWRTQPGNAWWASYREPHPEVSTHAAHPDAGWKNYFSPQMVAMDAAENFSNSGGKGVHHPMTWRTYNYPHDEHEEMWTHALGRTSPAQQATAALMAAGEDLGDIIALAGLGGFTASLKFTGDQANSAWGSENVAERPPGKPYGATSPPDKDQDPGSYGFLSAPDPDNWGEIQDNSAYQMPLTNTASLPPHLAYPDISSWQDPDQDSFGYADRSNTAGPATSISPSDPEGLSVDAELHDEPEAALPSTTGDDIEATAAADGTIGGNDAGTGEDGQEPGDVAGLGEFGAGLWPTFVRHQLRTIADGPGADPELMGSGDEYLTPDDQSIQTMGNQQWSGGGTDSDETAVEPGQPQGDADSIVAAFQRSAAAGAYGSGVSAAAGGDVAAAAREYLSKTADVLPRAEADELINEGKGQRARNLNLLSLAGTHYEEQAADLERRGVSVDDFDDDVISA